MLEQDFERLFDRARRRALRFPRWFRFLVTMRAAAGVGFVVLLGVAAVLMIGWALSPLFDGGFQEEPVLCFLRGLLAIPALHLLMLVSRMLRGRFPAPDGLALGPDEAPALFDLLERLRRRFGTPPIHSVCITGELNAAITQRPNRWIGVPMRNTLVMGLPLTLATSPRQFVAVLAHEFGHLRRQRIALGGIGCYLRALWHQVLENMEAVASPLQPAFSLITEIETPLYCAESLVLSHLDELEADACAAEVVGAKRLGEALAEIALKHRFLADDYWAKVYAQANHSERPSILPYRHMAAALRAGFDREAFADWFEALSHDQSDESRLSTHPSLRTRVHALGLAEPGDGVDTDSAARRFLGESVARLAGELDQQWWQGQQRSWRKRHWEVTRALDKIAKLESEGAQLGVSERLELALLVERYAGDRDPLSVYRELMPQAPGRPDALLAMGRLLLGRGDPTGVAYLRRAIGEDDAVGLQAAALLIEHYESSGIGAAARPYRKRLGKLLRQAQLVQAALDAPLEALRCLPPGLEMHELRALVRDIRRHDPVRRAYVVRRRCELAPRWRAYILVLCVEHYALDGVGELAQEIEAGITIPGLWRVLATPVDSGDEAILCEVRGARFFSRKDGAVRV
ncbi:M48 family metallopeptidase [Niveibacterium sp.]|uniref:M48 family metallopeptidase n=1 Tax=Niveibacterium sp. TaxID=2017444 RepID=UPI0035B00EA7